MKAVVYHADAVDAFGEKAGDRYKRLFWKMVENCHKFGLQVVHVTLTGHEGWGDENFYVPGLDPQNVMLNREICFTTFLEQAPDDVYWFSETDYRIRKMWPPLVKDCALLYRDNDSVKLNPSWRMARKSALPVFQAIRNFAQNVEITEKVTHAWHCDSAAFIRAYRKMGAPDRDTTWLGVDIELRKYSDYVKGNCIYGRNYLGQQKKELLETECPL